MLRLWLCAVRTDILNQMNQMDSISRGNALLFQVYVIQFIHESEEAMAEFPIPSFSNTDRSKLRAAFPKVEAVFRDSFKATPSPGLSYGVVVDGELALAG